MEAIELQQQFFQQLKNRLQPHLSLAEEVAEQLHISTDSAYRRIRGEKAISLPELQKLCRHFQISLDQLMNLDSSSIIFHGKWADATTFNFEQYLATWLQSLRFISSAKKKLFIYEAKDIPLHHYYQFDLLARFKFFFWMRTIMAYDEFVKVPFEDFQPEEKLFQTGRDILRLYNKIPSIEIWTYETVNSTLRQIEYYEAAGILKNRDTAQVLFSEVDKLISHISEQAATGEKFYYGEKAEGEEGNFQLYFNEISTGHNTGLAEMDGQLAVYLNHGVMNYIVTHDRNFCEQTRKSLDNTMKKSTLISSVSEKVRSRFFSVLHQKVEEGKKFMVTNFR